MNDVYIYICHMLFADDRNSPWSDGFLPRRKEYDVMHSDQQADEQELGPGVLLVLSRNGWEWGDEFVCNSYYGSFPHSRSEAPDSGVAAGNSYKW